MKKKTCGSCTLCCQLVPVEEIGLPAFTRCPKLRSVVYATPGCSIYPDRPRSCKAWNCQWLVEDWPDDLRPDRCGVVVDIIPELIWVNGKEMPAIQMWAASGAEMSFMDDPIAAVVRAAVEQDHAVIWRWRGEDGKQTGRAILRDPQTGQLVATAETPPSQAFSRAVPMRDRVRRAITLEEKLDAKPFLTSSPPPKGKRR